MKKILVFMGTRPEAIKMAPVVAAIDRTPGLQCRVIATGQHREMFQQVAKTFGFEAHVSLDVMRPNQTLGKLTARLLDAIDDVLVDEQPDMALVQGDTSTVLAAALACFYRRVPIGHVEAGLRTGDMLSPFPEEANRRLAAPLVNLHFAPTASAAEALLKEGVDPQTVLVTGNTVIDALQMEVARQEQPAVRSALGLDLAQLLGADWQSRPYVLITGHRRENFGDGIAQICHAIATLSREYPTHRFIYPVHLNPNVDTHVRQLLSGLDNVLLVPPQGYSHFVTLMSHCKLVLTDSGGVQEEAPALGKPVLVMRETTERPEGVTAGTARLTGPSAPAICHHVRALLDDPVAYEAMAQARNPYGDGHAAQRIVDRLVVHLDAARSR